LAESLRIILHNQKSNIIKGAAFLSLSAFLFALMGVFIRLASHHDGGVNNANIVFFRNLIGCTIFIPLLLQKGITPFKTKVLHLHFIRMFVGLAAMYCFFYAIQTIKLANAMLFTYSAPIFAPAIAALWLKERFNPKMAFPIGLGFLGVILITDPTEDIVDINAIVGLASSFLAATAFVTVRSLSFTEPPFRIVFYFTAFSTIVSSFPLIWFHQPLTLEQIELMAVVGILATTSQFCLTTAYQQASTSEIGCFAYLAIVFSGIFAWGLWAEVPDALSVIGALCVFTSGFITLYSQRKKTKPL
jgi:drug/metabolite transporter (DMT)-like permease